MDDATRRRLLWAWLLFVAGVTGCGFVVLSVWYPRWRSSSSSPVLGRGGTRRAAMDERGKPYAYPVGTIIGRLDEPVLHECEPGGYLDDHGGRLWANNAPEGTVWRCECGALYVHRWRTKFPSDGSDWKPFTKRERRPLPARPQPVLGLRARSNDHGAAG